MDTRNDRHRWQALATLCVTMFMAMLDNVIVNIALPRIGRDLDAGISGLQWVAEGYSLVYAALLLTGGTLGDRHGRTRVYRIGLALFTLGSAAAALAGGTGALVAARMLQGVGAALLTPGSLAILRQVFTDEKERARAIGLWSGVSALGLSVGPVVGGPMVDAFGWASVFWINVPVGLVGLVLAYRVLPEVAPRERRVDLPGLLLSAGGLGALVYGLVEGPGRGWTDARVLACGAVAVVLLALFAVVELRVAEPMLELRLFRDRVMAGALLSGLMVSFGMFGAMFFLPLMLQGVMRWTPTDAGYAGLPLSAVIVFAAPLSGRLTARYGARPPLVLGIALCAVGLGGLSLYSGQAHYWSYAWTLVLLGSGMGLTFTPVSIAVLQRVAPAQTGMASATVSTLRELGGVLGIAVLGAVLTNRLTGALTAALHRQGLPADGVPHAVSALTGHAGTGTGAAPAAPVLAAVDASFVDALHLALRCGSAALAATAVLVALLLRPAAAPAADAAPSPALSGAS
ncbi:MFS transporter [Kitasatospora phosalacinea]|uniref:MFS transporter n=1 Tax=Kitasatospora phosalacinea TaxID=2065 RepID=A0A9W6UNJ3_9ACTN|nr:MFS transporter [Kitasatospora phosalacinea]GLW56516.1 MFS transporter [Kitasatospora phosalacinea]